MKHWHVWIIEPTRQRMAYKVGRFGSKQAAHQWAKGSGHPKTFVRLCDHPTCQEPIIQNRSVK